MVDRQDIDALLIGSLYGELSSTEEARLKAHLDAHPADRAALAELSQTRETVRNRLLEVEVEPPSSISALLMQEAARRAPRLKSEGEREREGWFARFVRSFVAHPAMAAAMMLVVVVGVAGTMYLRKGDHFAETTAGTEARAQLEAPAEEAALAPELGAKDKAAELPAAAPVTGGEVGGEAGGEAEAVPGRARGYTVALDEGGEDRDGWSGKDTKREVKADAIAATHEAKPREPSAEPAMERGRPASKQAAPPADAARSPKGAGPGFLEVTTQQSPKNAAVKELDDAPEPAKKQRAAEPPVASKPMPAPRTVARDDDRAGTGAGARSEGAAVPTAPMPAAPPPPPPAIAPAQPSPDVPRAAEADAEWAKSQHARVVAQVRAGNCRDAATLAVTLSNRAPGYFAQNVESDRAVKDCLALINVEREKVELANRAKRANAADTPNANAPNNARKAAPAKPASSADTKKK